LERTNIISQNRSVSELLSGEAPGISNNGDPRDMLHVMTVPFSLIDGNVACVVVVRRTVPFVSADRDCVLYLLKALFMCQSLRQAQAESQSLREHVAESSALSSEESADRDRQVADLVSEFLKDICNPVADWGSAARPLEKLALRPAETDDDLESLPVASELDLYECAKKTIQSSCELLFGRSSDTRIHPISHVEFQVFSQSKNPPVIRDWDDDVKQADGNPMFRSFAVSGVSMSLWMLQIDRGASKGSLSVATMVVYSRQWGSRAYCVRISYPSIRTSAAVHSLVVYPMLEMRSVLLLRMVSAQDMSIENCNSVMTLVLDLCRDQISRLQSKCKEMKQLTQVITGDKDSFIMSLKAKHDESIQTIKDKYKAIIFDRSRASKLSEMFLKCMTSACSLAARNYLMSTRHEDAKVLEYLKSKHASAASMLLKTLLRVCEEICRGDDMDVHVDICFHKGKESSRERNSLNTTVNSNGGSELTMTWVELTALRLKNPKKTAPPTERTSVGSTHPIFLAATLGSYVLAAPESGQPDSLDEIESYQRKINGIPIILCKTTDYIPGTLFVPIVSKSPDAIVTFVAIVSPRSIKRDNPVELPQGPISSNWSVSLKNVIFCWNAVRDLCVSVAKHHDSIVEERVLALSRKRLNGAATLAITVKKITSARLRRAFVKWSSGTQMDSKLELINRSFDARSNSFARRIQYLEQSLADWAETVRSANGVAAGQLTNGLRGVWAQACVPFMSLMAGDVEVMGCGLLIANHMDEILELNVRHDGAPNVAATPQSPGSVSGAESVEIRPASELGAGVLSLTWSIINGTLDGNIGAAKRLWKLNRQDSFTGRDGDDPTRGSDRLEQMWLVPVRTAWAVLGVLRLSIRQTVSYFDRNGRANADGEAAAALRANRDDESESESTGSTERPLEQAKRKMINFAEVIAPVILAARQIDVARTREREMSSELEANQLRVRAAASETHTSILKNNYILNVIANTRSALDSTILGEVEKFTGVSSAKDSDIVTSFTSSSELPRAMLESLKQQLDHIFSSSLKHEVAVTWYYPVTWGSRSEDRRSKEAYRRFSHPIVNVLGETIGVIEVKNTDGIVLRSSEEKPANIDDSFQNGIPEFSLEKNIDMSTHRHAEASAVEAVLPDLASLATTLLYSTVRKGLIDTMVASNASTIRTLEEKVTAGQAKVVEALNVADECSSIAQHSKHLQEIYHRCMTASRSIAEVCYASPTSNNNGDSVGRADVPKSAEVWLSVKEILNGLCDSLGAVMGGKCVFRFGVVTVDKASALLDNGKMLEGEDVVLHWYSGARGMDAIGPQGSFTVCGIDIGSSGARIASNLATSCVSSADVSLVNVGAADGKADNITVRTYPMILRTNSKALESSVVGVTQMFCPESSLDKSSADEYCAQIAGAVGDTVVNAKVISDLSLQLETLSDVAVNVQKAAETVQSTSELYRSRAACWKHISFFADVIIRGVSSGKPLLALLFSEDAMDSLRNAGIRLKKVSATEADEGFDGRSLSSVGEENSSFSLANMTLPVPLQSEVDSDKADAIIEISCFSSTPASGTRSGGKEKRHDKFAEEIVSIVGSLIQTMVGSIKYTNNVLKEAQSVQNNAESRVLQLHSELERLQKENQVLDQHRIAAISKMDEHLSNDVRTQRVSAQFLESVALPAVREAIDMLSKLLEHYANLPRKDIDLNSGSNVVVDLRAAQILDKAYSGIAVLGDKTMARFLSLVQNTQFERRDENSSGVTNVLHRSTPLHTVHEGPVYFHVSVVVRRDRVAKGSSDTPQYPRYAVYDGASGGHKVVPDSEVSQAFAFDAGIHRQHQSVLERCFKHRGVQGHDLNIADVNLTVNLSPIDLLGIDHGTISNLTSKYSPVLGTISKDSIVYLRSCCVPLSDGVANDSHSSELDAKVGSYRNPAVLRCLWLELRSKKTGNYVEGTDDIPVSVGKGLNLDDVFQTNSLRQLMELVASNTVGLLRCISEVAIVDDKLRAAKVDVSKIQDEYAHLEELVARNRRIYKIVQREASALLDPPASSLQISAAVGHEDSVLVSESAAGGLKRPAHPAYLAPISATEDVCLKLLALIRNLVRSEGQAVMLTDVETSPLSYQIIATGDALYWQGVEQGTFGRVFSSNSMQSVVESAMLTHKPVVVEDLQKDGRYLPQVDGGCAPKTPCLFIPLRGRGGVIIGVVIAARGGNGASFTVEDIIAAEMIVSMASLSLYWCRGLGAIHVQLEKTSNRLAKLELTVQSKSRNDGKKSKGVAMLT
jgi:hypothetical protein